MYLVLSPGRFLATEQGVNIRLATSIGKTPRAGAILGGSFLVTQVVRLVSGLVAVRAI
jgi:hypothetical protein